jgi:hypothetical protein
MCTDYGSRIPTARCHHGPEVFATGRQAEQGADAGTFGNELAWILTLGEA